MNKILKSTLLATLLTNTLMAEVVFDLGAQQLSESQAKTYKLSSYDLGKTVISTGMASQTDGGYRPNIHGVGSMTVQIKEPKENWGITFHMYCYLSGDGCGATLIGENGNTINIALDYESISVEGKQTKVPTLRHGETIQGSIHTINDSDEIEIVINGAHKYQISKANFKVAQVALSLNTEGSNKIIHMDKVTNLVISTSDD